MQQSPRHGKPKAADSSIATVSGVAHTVYRIEDNDALSGLAGKGTKLDTVTTDQLGNTRNDPPSIGAVEKVETPVVSPTTLTITGTEGTAITSQTITVTKGEDVTWSASGTLPDGLKAESADKTFTISGTPAVGSAKTDAYTYTVTAKNSAGSTPVTVTITIKAVAPVLDQTGEISKTFTEGVKIEDITIKATSGSNLTWTADSSKLPKGLTGKEAADKASFTISGTPETGSAGSYTYAVTAASATGDKAEVTYKITVNAAAASVKPVLDTTEKSINAVEGTAIETLTINATAGDNLTWSASGTLPNGLKASSADKTFTISGTPAVGTAQNKAYSYTVKAANSAGEASAVITITVSALTAPALDVTTASITANEGQEIDSLTITATAGNNLTWTTSGDLPDGLTGTAASDKMSFTISGTPSDSTARMDAYTYSVTAMNTAGSASAVITITVNSTGGINDEVSNALEELAATGESMTLEDALTKSLGLSEEQLKTVTSITIPSNITDLGDLASLLPNLEAIDLTSATSLTEVDLRGNTSIKEVTIAGNSSVTTLDLRNSAVETLDATGCDELTEVNIAGNTNIQTLSLDECPNIEEFNAEGCENLTDLSLSNKGSEGRRGKLSSLELRGCRNLKNLGFKGNMMKRFHVRDFSLNSLETLSAGDQAVGNVTLSRRFSFIDFFRNLLFNSNVSISESESESDSELTELELKISAESGDSNVKSVTAYDEGDNKISSSYDPETGEAVFSSTPARIEYDYDTGFDSEESMDVAISGEGLEDNGDMTLNNSSSGGCNSSFASGALLAFLGFILAKSKSHKH
ncbi:MAG: putative Ig domain-containing protein [Synergistaceae bacterium]|nr:putative Ig domain-containing protein [Synergistaceae bacterium]